MFMEFVLEACGDIWEWLMGHLLYINLFLSVVIVFFQRRDPKAVWTWLLALYFVPIFGFVLYMMLGQDFRKNKSCTTFPKESARPHRRMREPAPQGTHSDILCSGSCNFLLKLMNYRMIITPFLPKNIPIRYIRILFIKIRIREAKGYAKTFPWGKVARKAGRMRDCCVDLI